MTLQPIPILFPFYQYTVYTDYIVHKYDLGGKGGAVRPKLIIGLSPRPMGVGGGGCAGL
jgi:hypothetical protein